MSLANTRYRYYTKIVDFVNLNKTFSAVSEKFTLYANATLKISSAGVPNLKTTPAYIWTWQFDISEYKEQDTKLFSIYLRHILTDFQKFFHC